VVSYEAGISSQPAQKSTRLDVIASYYTPYYNLQMTLTVRTDPATELALARFAARTKRTKSDVVKQALNEFLQKQAEPAPTPWDLLQDLLPTEANPKLPNDLSARRKEYLIESLEEKHARRRGSAGRDV
jgi:hypothetical protein